MTLFSTIRFLTVSLTYIVALTVFGGLALLGPFLIFSAPVFSWAMGGLISGTSRYFDDLEKARNRRLARREVRVARRAAVRARKLQLAEAHG